MNYSKLCFSIVVVAYISTMTCNAGTLDTMREYKDTAIQKVKDAGSKVSEKSTLVGKRVSEGAYDAVNTVKYEAQETWFDFKEAYEEVRETVAPQRVKKENFLAGIEHEQERAITKYILNAIEKSGALNYLTKTSKSYTHLKSEQLEVLVHYYFICALSAFNAEKFKLSTVDFESLCQRSAEHAYAYLNDEMVDDTI